MQAKKFSVQDFAENHPGGLLGRKITLKVADLMLKGDEIPKCLPSDQLIDQLHELSGKRCGCLLVTDEQNVLKGIFTDGDLRRSIEKHGSCALNMPLEKLMTPTPQHLSSKDLAGMAARVMEGDLKRLITVLPVVDDGHLVGLIRMHDILQKELI
jgi:arabinose-5-phosphate isomerase